MLQRKFKTRRLREQTLVMTDASSEMGELIALQAAEKGANIVLASGNSEKLELLRDEVTKNGGNAIVVPVDVTHAEDLLHLKKRALDKFGRIDTWINNARSSFTGYLLESDIEDERKIFDKNFWSTRIASTIAIGAMKDEGGVIINLGPEISVSSLPLHGIYSASKHAIKVFTDTLRGELKNEGIPIEVSLVHPMTTDSSFATAEAIVKCAENPQRDIYVGGPARLTAILDTFFPQVSDLMAESRMKELKNLEDHSADLSAKNVLKTLKDNLATSLRDFRGEDSH
jgi:short-subunit dehydrogenase